MDEYLAHFAHGCATKREGRGSNRKRPLVAEDLPGSAGVGDEGGAEAAPVSSAFEAAEAGEYVWVREEEAVAADCPALFPLRDSELADDFLDLLVADMEVDKKLSVSSRFVKPAELLEEFHGWWVQQRLFAKPQQERMSNMAEELAKTLVNSNASAGTQRALFTWLRDSVGSRVSVAESSVWPKSFGQFRGLVDERSPLIVETVLCGTPRISMVHIPLLLALREVALAPDTVCAIAAPTDDLAGVRTFCDAEKFRRITSNVGPNVSFAVWSLFVDKTRLVQHGTRKGHVILACPLNNPRGRFDIVAFVPSFTEEDAAKAGLSEAKAVLMRAHLQQQALRVVLLFGGFRNDSPMAMLENDHGDVVRCRNVLGNTRADGEELCSLVCRVIAASDKHAKELACYRHQIRSTQLSEVVKDPDHDHNFYCHNAAYRTFFDNLLANVEKQSATATKESFKKFGVIPIRPALFDAWLFDCAQDVVGDIQHVGPHGIGLFLLHNLTAALHSVFPDREGSARVRRDVYPARGAHLELVLMPTDIVVLCLAPPPNVQARSGCCWVRRAVGEEGFAPCDALTVIDAVDTDFVAAMREFDDGLREMGSSYVHSYKRFDFRSLEEASQSEGTLFGRATTVEMVLLYAPFILAYVLRNAEGAQWIVDTFLLYNRFYWNWRRVVHFGGDSVVMDDQRFAVKTLLKEHWAKFSKTSLNFMKFEQLDHVVHDLRRHGPVRYTGTGPGDNAHIRVAKMPFRMSNKTKDENVLNRQLLSFGRAPFFVAEIALLPKAKQPGPTLVGRVSLSMVNHVVVALIRQLKGQEWDSEMANLPNNVMRSLFQFWCERLGHTSLSYQEFTAWKVRLFHTARIGNGVDICASDSFHKTSRHDFVRLRDGSICRLVALMSLGVPTVGEKPMVLAEETVLEAVAKLRPLGVPILSESSTWKWVALGEVKDVVCCLRHPADRSFHFVIRKKHEESLWV